MIFPAVHRFVQFGNHGYQFFGWRNLEGRGPMLIHVDGEIDKPLTHDVIADKDKGDGKGLDVNCNEVVHVWVSVKP